MKGGASEPRKLEQVNPVHKMNIFNETVGKERKYSHRNRTDEYSINPFTMQNISEKPNHITPSHPYKLVKMDNLQDDIVGTGVRA